MTPRRHDGIAAAALLAVIALATTLRASKMSSLFPILVDESIYLRWAEIIDHQGEWFVSLLDGKQPLSYWIYALLRMLLPEVNPLLSARFVSISAGTVSTLLLFVIGKRLAGARAGVVAALFYALLPYGVFYDRLAYTDALVNCLGIGVAAASLACFMGGRATAGRASIVGVVLGIGIFTKATTIPFALIPAAAAGLWHRHDLRRAALGLLVIYGVAVLPPIVSWLSIPDGPTFATNDLLFHRTSFFTPLSVLAHQPLVNVWHNSGLLAEYLRQYVTPLFVVLALASVFYLAVRREPAAVFAFAACLVPLSAQVVVLQYFPSRYVFPHVWPLVLCVAVALHRLTNGRLAQAGVTALASLPLAIGTASLLATPHQQLHWTDASEFLSSGPYSGYGVQEAIEYIKGEAAAGPLVVLTDPIWGTPADAMYPQLNLRPGIKVYDAWWAQLSETESLLPKGRREVMKSQYQRVSDGFVDFTQFQRVMYVTDTNYHLPTDVHRREPAAKLVVRFPKPNGRDFVDVYQLR